MIGSNSFRQLDDDPTQLAERLLPADGRLLLVGESGVGKSTLAAQLAAAVTEQGRRCFCLSVDPGSPAFGAPGAVNLGEWQDSGWRALDLEAVCSLDAGRFRLPLLLALQRLLRRVPAGALLIDSPGLVRGVAGAELVEGLVRTTAAQQVLVLARQRGLLPLADELMALAPQVYWVQSSPLAISHDRTARAQRRTALWDAYLAKASVHALRLRDLSILGTPPPQSQPAAWRGRQAALLSAGRTCVLGEVLVLKDGVVTLRVPQVPQQSAVLLVRDAMRTGQMLVTAKPAIGKSSVPEAPRKGGLQCRLGNFDLTLVNGVLGDPLLQVRLRRERRSLLFDLGDVDRLSVGALHTVSDIFISHAHFDHIGGFLGLLRHRLSEPSSCRLYGPPELARHIAGFLQGVRWDRIDNRGPTFEVCELHDDRIRRFRLQAGQRCRQLPDAAAVGGLLRSEADFRVRAVALDHGYGTPSLAYSLETPRQLKVRGERVAALGLAPGPWLNELKRRVRAGGAALGELTTTDGRQHRVEDLARDLLLDQAGVKLVYATDLADTIDNRARLTQFAQQADLFFCEAAFMLADAEQAERTGHLTTRACLEIAAVAEVRRLVPFHFSRRYETRVDEVYAELGHTKSARD